ncbi:DUF3990 domain-containing protein [Cohnella rhizosphaerae]|uniref:DUF3990 domain-containing protein n=1 Tax=Cohnella rhizosphaerae TaxID=1457232 RepID=A0A9X4KRB5_9BACL|nr:DUF3990 domain-containing protein [Cohnella rhizosphaerae]MDG0809689.1 DUF3990 domain-containing protein [Cohnella rhizosphaerae]
MCITATQRGALAGGLKTKLINFEFLRESRNRDFGTGFYTTIDLNQAMTWPVGKLIRRIESGAETISSNEIPAVAKIRIYPERYGDDISVKDFRGESFDWVRFVLNHRYDSSLDRCLCDTREDMPHPQIVCGSMADNDTGDVIAEFIQSGMSLDEAEHINWFGRNITRSRDGNRLLGLELGDQIAFF